ncbi:DNA polymerase Y family protein [Corynebacterium aquatimens]|nr:DNA polymerase Y family protein [Corynebacterium aquatimens]
MRVAAVWFPDWPIHAAVLDADDALVEPLAIGVQHRIKVVSAHARKRGVRRGMKVRHAQSVCPGLRVIEDNPDRDGRMFAALAESFDDVASSVEVLRPGLVVVDLAAPARFHGGEDVATEMLIDAASRRGIDALAGAADELATAMIAARCGHVVPPGESAQFLASQPLSMLTAEVSLGADPETVGSLRQLGISTLGELAALPVTAVSTRFGAAGLHCHRIARAAPDRRVAPELPVEDLAVAITPDDPIQRVDEAAFGARMLAARLHEKLRDAGCVCMRLKVIAQLVDGTRVERIWRTRDALTEAATADRVRWQLDSWLTGGGAGAIESLILDPVEVALPESVGELWGSTAGRAAKMEAQKVAERVQSSLGIDAVVQPHLVGGRGVAERIALVPFGEQPPVVPDAAWPGAIPEPLPTELVSPRTLIRGGGIDHPASRIVLIDDAANKVGVTAEVLLTSTPYALAWGKDRYVVTGWAGPWPVDEGWWTDTPLKVARMQVTGTGEAGPMAWLLMWVGQQWKVEAIYR